MKRKIISLLLCLVMALSLIPTVAFGAGIKTMQWDWLEHNNNTPAPTEADTNGLKYVKVNASALEGSNVSIAVSAVREHGVTIGVNKGYYLYQYSIRCEDKYRCQTAASGHDTRATLSNTGDAEITLDLSNANFSHSNGSNQYWLLLKFDQDNTQYKVTYDWGGLKDSLTAAVPVDSNGYLVNASVTVLQPSETAIAAAAALGYEFTGWKLNDTVVGEKFAMPKSNVTLIAQWKKVEPETTSVTVTKEWVDDNNSFNTRPDSVTVNLLKDGKETGKTLTLTKDNWSGSFTDVFAGGNYTVSEEPVPGYTSQVIVPGEPVVTVGALEKVPNCNFKTFNTKGANLVIAKLTENDGYVVWTKTPLTNDQKDTLLVQVKAACNIPDNKTVDFISGENVTHTSNGETATFADGTLSFTKTKMWSMFWYGNVTESQSNNGFTIVNTLNIKEGELVPATLTIKKVDSNDNTKPLSGAEFTLTNEGGQVVDKATTDAEGTCVFDELAAGTYTLTETAAPEGYEKPSTPWTVTVEETKVIQEVKDDATGAVVGYKEVTTCIVSMVGADTDNDGVFIIPNTELPEPVKVDIPVTKNVTISRGSKEPAETLFTFEASVGDQKFTLPLIPKKAENWTATGMLRVSIPYELFKDGVATVTIKEIPGGDTRWKYDTKEYKVLVYENGTYTVNPQIAARATADQAQEPTALTFTNEYNYKYTPTPRPTTPAKPVTSVKTGDMGVALYAGLAILSMTGSAGVILRRRKNDK